MLHLNVVSSLEADVRLHLCTSEPVQNRIAESVKTTAAGGLEYLHDLPSGDFELQTTLQATRMECSSVLVDGVVTGFDQVSQCIGKVDPVVVLHFVPGNSLIETELNAGDYDKSFPPGMIVCHGKKGASGSTGGSAGKTKSSGGGGCLSWCWSSPTDEGDGLAGDNQPPQPPGGGLGGTTAYEGWEADPNLQTTTFQTGTSTEQQSNVVQAQPQAQSSGATGGVTGGSNEFSIALDSALTASGGLEALATALSSNAQGLGMLSQVQQVVGSEVQHLQSWHSLLTRIANSPALFERLVQNIPTGLRVSFNSYIESGIHRGQSLFEDRSGGRRVPRESQEGTDQ